MIINENIINLKKSKNSMMFVICQKLLIEIINENKNPAYDIDSEKHKLEQAAINLQRLL